MVDPKKLIILVGMPRSGTTWIGKLFDSHPDVLYLHEPDSIRPLNNILPLLPDKDYDANVTGELNEYLDGILTACPIQCCAKLPIFPKHYRKRTENLLFKGRIYLNKLGESLLGRIRQIDVSSAVNSDTRIVWKSIESLGRVGSFIEGLKGCKAIVILRHPCGYVASVLRGEANRNFSDSCPSAEDWDLFELLLNSAQARALGLTMDDLRRLPPEARLTWKWIVFNEKALSFLEIEDRLTVVKYEDLCESPDVTCRLLFEWAGLSWNPQTEAFLSGTISKHDDGFYSVYRNPSLAARKWTEELSDTQVKNVFSMLEKSRLSEYYRA
ncbi:sulfotransferase [Methylocaldum szegediense]|uniref:Sulfotransferase n=1 Tax=Methylocaldum szegediense TaxID=73780 RepID=A0ABN8X9Z7_9GAMM|nr:sulfotransferase [Methylocaldum szegediense]CAI8966248.1 conserved protein of unknown function [Methylocaldum szegediense]